MSRAPLGPPTRRRDVRPTMSIARYGQMPTRRGAIARTKFACFVGRHPAERTPRANTSAWHWRMSKPLVSAMRGAFARSVLDAGRVRDLVEVGGGRMPDWGGHRDANCPRGFIPRDAQAWPGRWFHERLLAWAAEVGAASPGSGHGEQFDPQAISSRGAPQSAATWPRWPDAEPLFCVS